MIINRIDSEKELNRKIERLELIIGKTKYTITPDFDGFRVHSHNGAITVRPGSKNEIIIGD